MMNENKTNTAASQENVTEIDLIKLLKALWKRAWIIIVVAVLAAGAAFEYATLFIKPQYESTAEMYVNNTGVSIGSASLSISGSSLSAAQSLVKTYIEILKTRSTLEKVIEEAELVGKDGNVMTYEELKKKVSAGAVNNTEIFSITVTDTDPERAKLIANTIVIILPYQIQEIVEGSSVKTVDWAVRGVKSAPNRTRITLIGFLIGAAAVIAVLVILFMNDKYIHDEDYLLENYNIPLLAVIPDLNRKSAGKYRYKKYGYGKYGGYRGRAYGYYRERVDENEAENGKTGKNS